MKANNPLWRSPEGSSRKRRKTLKKCEESENGLELCFKGGTGDGRGGWLTGNGRCRVKLKKEQDGAMKLGRGSDYLSV